jgi:hypothetical protein
MRDYHRLDMAIAIGIFTTLKANVNLHQAIGFRALYGANLVTYPADFRGSETRVAHRVADSFDYHRLDMAIAIGIFIELFQERYSSLMYRQVF